MLLPYIRRIYGSYGDIPPRCITHDKEQLLLPHAGRMVAENAPPHSVPHLRHPPAAAPRLTMSAAPRLCRDHKGKTVLRAVHGQIGGGADQRAVLALDQTIVAQNVDQRFVFVGGSCRLGCNKQGRGSRTCRESSARLWRCSGRCELEVRGPGCRRRQTTARGRPPGSVQSASSRPSRTLRPSRRCRQGRV